MSKEDNFGGGVQKGMVDDLFLTIGPLITGNIIPAADAIALLSALAATQTDALNPGPGQTGFLDAFSAFDKLDTAYQKWKLATPATITADTGVLITAIKELQRLSANGPIPAGFFTIVP